MIYPGPANKVEVQRSGGWLGGIRNGADGWEGSRHHQLLACLSPTAWLLTIATPCAAQVEATCIIEGQYALTGVQNWPAQMQLCGPTGGAECSGISYDSSEPLITPSG